MAAVLADVADGTAADLLKMVGRRETVKMVEPIVKIASCHI